MTGYAMAELQAVLRGACRGLGCSPALGDELAEAVAMAGPAFASWQELDAVFADPLEGLEQGGTVVRCLVDGPSIADKAVCSDAPLTLAQVDAPAILQLYLDRAARAFDLGLHLEQDDDAGWQVVRSGDAQAVSEPCLRVDLPAGLYERLNALAARCFVPATEATRLSGAGAGLNDND